MKHLLMVILLVIPILTSCGDGSTTQTEDDIVTEDSANEENKTETESMAEIDRSDIKITGDGLELLDAYSDEGYMYTKVQNNSNLDYDEIIITYKFYDEEGAVISTENSYGSKIESGEIWKEDKILPYGKTISKIKIIEISGKSDGNSSNTNESGLSSNGDNENTAIKDAKTLVYQNIKSPSSAKWVSSEVVEEDDYGRYIVDIVLDSQNSFGAQIRSGFIVALQSIVENGAYYRESFFMKEYEYNNSYKREQALAYIKSFNDFGEPKKGASQNSDSASEKLSQQSSSQSYSEDKELLNHFNDIYNSYVTTLTEAINTGDISVANGLIKGDEFYKMQENLVENLSSRGITETAISTDVISYEEIEPNIYQLYCCERIGINHPEKGYEEKDFYYYYTYKYDEGFTEIEAVN